MTDSTANTTRKYKNQFTKIYIKKGSLSSWNGNADDENTGNYFNCSADIENEYLFLYDYEVDRIIEQIIEQTNDELQKKILRLMRLAND